MRVSAFHHSNRIASGSFDGTVRIWNNGTQEDVLFFFSEAVECLEVTPDDNKIIIVLADSSKALSFDFSTKSIHEIGGGKVFRGLFGTNPSCTKTGIITFEDELYFYDHNSLILSSPVYIDNVSGDSLIWLDDTSICIPRRNGSVVIVDSVSKSVLNEYQLHEGIITSIWKDENEIVTVSEDGTGKIFDSKFNPVSGFKIPFTPQSVCFDQKSDLVVVSGDRNLLFVERSSGSIKLTQQELSGCNPAISIASEVYRGTGENNITVYSEGGEILREIKGRSKTVEDVVFLNNSSLVYASGDRYVHKFELLDGTEESLVSHSETVSTILYNPKDNMIIAGSYDDSISLWDLINRSEIKRIKKVPLVTSLTLSPNFSYIGVACSGDNSIHVFNVEGKLISRWEAHNDFISTVHFMNDEILVSGSDDESLRFWKPDGKLISSVSFSSAIKSIATTPELEYIIVGLDNGELSIIEKISNRKISNYSVQNQIQCIEILSENVLLFASKNVMFRMELDGPNIVAVDEIIRHTEPIRGIYWDSQNERIISVDHSVEILETQLFERGESVTSEDIDEESSTTVIFAPNGEKTDISLLTDQIGEKSYSKGEIQTETVFKVLEYLNTVSLQLSTSIFPELNKMDISTDVLQQAFATLISKLEIKVKEKNSDKNTLETEKKTKPKQDWRNFDWGKRKE
jgi:WD40 repeat protein